ncbi:hypothetical protein J7U46_22885 [Pelomonas sp. V22]|uniref:hypothetical protein n=1 Tax=Pelomonas sp. V22 TaxID=2822139 RepID=UPI0024A959FB|nr:hypothetical protein [Pelomonas sp. V22]MDI4635918.1 hypothetical protein [Pelomonas sp. V22]
MNCSSVRCGVVAAHFTVGVRTTPPNGSRVSRKSGAIQIAQDLKDTYYIAKAKAEASYKAWDAKPAGTEKDSSWTQVVTDRVAANKAARKAKIDPPYTFD